MTSSPTDRSPYASSPLWSLIGIAMGGLVSIYLVPSQAYYTFDDLAPAALALTAGLLAGTAVAGIRSPVALFRAESILSLGLFYWLLLDLVLGQGGVAPATRASVVQSLAAITLFAITLWIGSILAALSPWGAPSGGFRRSDVGVTARFLFAAALISGVLGAARVVLGCSFSPSCIVEAFSQPRFAAVWLRFDAFGHFDTLFLNLRYFGFLVLPLTVALVNREGRFTWRSVLTLTLSLICLVFMVGEGGRKDVGTSVGASLLVWALMKQRVALRQLAGTAIACTALVLLMQFMLAARDIGVVAALDRSVSLRLSNEASPLGTVDRNFRFLANIMELVPERRPFEGWQGVAYSTTVWVPGGLVPRKWQQRNLDMARELGMQTGKGYSWTCSAIGDFYLMGGFAVVAVGGLLFGAMARFASRLLMGPPAPERSILYALLTMTLFLSLRALHEIFVTGLIVFAFSLLLGVRHVLKRDAVIRTA